MKAKSAFGRISEPRTSASGGRRGARPVVLAAVVAAILGGCVENEISFFVEHAKVQPKTPECVTTVSDEISPGGLLDLSMGYEYGSYFLVRNQLMSKEDYDNLKGETNGIFVDSYDVSVRTAATNEEVGTSERLPRAQYLEPESANVVFAYLMTPDIVSQMADATGCLPLEALNYPAESVLVGEPSDANGRAVGRDLGSVSASIKFYGHSQGGIDVETQRFTFSIRLCCGCLVNWSACFDPCSRYCSSASDYADDRMCQLGVANGEGLFDCRYLYGDPYATWTCMEEDPEDPDRLVQGTCDCSDC